MKMFVRYMATENNAITKVEGNVKTDSSQHNQLDNTTTKVEENAMTDSSQNNQLDNILFKINNLNVQMKILIYQFYIKKTQIQIMLTLMHVDNNNNLDMHIDIYVYGIDGKKDEQIRVCSTYAKQVHIVKFSKFLKQYFEIEDAKTYIKLLDSIDTYLNQGKTLNNSILQSIIQVTNPELRKIFIFLLDTVYLSKDIQYGVCKMLQNPEANLSFDIGNYSTRITNTPFAFSIKSFVVELDKYSNLNCATNDERIKIIFNILTQEFMIGFYKNKELTPIFTTKKTNLIDNLQQLFQYFHIEISDKELQSSYNTLNAYIDNKLNYKIAMEALLVLYKNNPQLKLLLNPLLFVLKAYMALKKNSLCLFENILDLVLHT